MAFNGVTVGAVVSELKKRALGGRIFKIQQPESNELHLIIKNYKDTMRLMISADAGLPLIYLTEETKNSPMQAPTFCMLLRKHIGNGRIVEINQPDSERIVELVIEHLDEMGDLCRKKLIVEIMGRYSNIIFTTGEGKILDAIRRVPPDMSSVRIVLPGETYSYPPSQGKLNPMTMTIAEFEERIKELNMPIAKVFGAVITGFSKVTGEELCYRAGVDGRKDKESLTGDETARLLGALSSLLTDIREERYSPVIVKERGIPKEFSSFKLEMYSDLETVSYESISEVLEVYYKERNAGIRISQKSYDLRHIVTTAVERTARKYDLQREQMKDTEDREIYRIYGELLNAYGYSAKPQDTEITCENYYDEGRPITIPLDPQLSAMENSRKYFEKYNKKKRTYQALETLLVETKSELDYLESVLHALSIAASEDDLREIHEELKATGIVRTKTNKKGEKKKAASKPMHFVSEAGYDIYVGKNNIQNDYLSFDFADGNDMWFHAKKIPGSHVIVKRKGQEELPDSVYEDAARLAAYFSSGNKNPKVEIDYTERKNLKKPAGQKPGFVIYHTNYSMVAEPNIDGLKEVL